MAYDAIFARSFSRYEQKKLTCGALVGCLLIVFSFCTVFRPYLGPLPILNLRLSLGVGHKLLTVKETESSQKQEIIRVAKNVTAKPEPLLISVNSQENVTWKPETLLNSTDHHAVETVTTKLEVQLNSADLKENVTRKPETLLNSTDHYDVSGNATTVPALQLNLTNFQEKVKKRMEPICKSLNPRTDICDIPREVRVQARSSTVYAASSADKTGALDDGKGSWKIRPYSRKTDFTAMTSVTEWFIAEASLDQQEIPKCTRNHTVPVILFSAGGYSGNHFHVFTDIIIPLYMTSRPFDGEVQFLVTDYRSWWVKKFQVILQNLSRYPIIDINQEQQEVHCFPSAIVGLKRSTELKVDPSMSSYTMKDFREFLRISYSLKRSVAIKLRDTDPRRPRLLIVSRKRTRTFMNVPKIARMAKALGFEPVVAEANMDVARFAELVNSCDAVMGVHGAGLTNILFLPDDAVLIQIVPLGGVEWLSKTYFGEPSKDMKLKYLEYKIGMSESTLIQQFAVDHVALKDPRAFHKGNWDAFKSVYLDKQNVKLDVRRFKPTLLKALELLHE